MTNPDERRALAGIRREPPRFRSVTVQGVRELTPRMLRVTFGGAELAGLQIDEPAASVRLLLPSPGCDLEIPVWNGNEFLIRDGSRPIIRTFTPLNLDPEALTIELDVVQHDGGAASTWAEAAAPGDPAAISGPGRGYSIDRSVAAYVLGGDETALPAIGQLIAAIPPEAHVLTIVEVTAAEAKLELPAHPNLTVEWETRSPADPPGAALNEAVRRAEIPSGGKVWVAGEAAAMHRIRRHLFDDRQLPRRDATVRGYWKHGR